MRLDIDLFIYIWRARGESGLLFVHHTEQWCALCVSFELICVQSLSTCTLNLAEREFSITFDNIVIYRWLPLKFVGVLCIGLKLFNIDFWLNENTQRTNIMNMISAKESERERWRAREWEIDRKWNKNEMEKTTTPRCDRKMQEKRKKNPQTPVYAVTKIECAHVPVSPRRDRPPCIHHYHHHIHTQTHTDIWIWKYQFISMACFAAHVSPLHANYQQFNSAKPCTKRINLELDSILFCSTSSFPMWNRNWFERLRGKQWVSERRGGGVWREMKKRKPIKAKKFVTIWLLNMNILLT